ncbi:citrate lyase subunit beta/citryl-CoA lyase [Murinocardiopsis flavida]|uniref:Citrate lyase subunit beta/citryl-CoA lyase n=1 Tax=Murinocardiopsis flavida TaxID=645275 RepID=A0A2P8CZS4_9ACTN|nr:CoA ester lyase [Murinocardiopsis flavida]PSK90471.1 citrate lyase subunit beta/citryl-CoA lyase [Murinocardiopsis flavida]
MSIADATPVTWLYVPGDRPDRFAKACRSGADAVILDLEDAVLAPAKDAARGHVLDFLTGGAPGGPPDGPAPQLHVRVNAPDGGIGRRDLAALAGAPLLDAVRVPKVRSPEDVAAVAAALGAGTALHCLLESALGVENAAAIGAHPAVRGLALGEADLAAQMNLSGDAAFGWLRSRVVLAAAANGLPAPAMSAYVDVADEEGLRASCAAGRALGMFGRTAIHPRQVPVIRRAFTPSDGEVARSREIVAAAEDGADDGAGAVALPDGRFIDAPIVESARRTLALADRLGRTSG